MTLSKVYLELTNRCNLSCSICYRRSWDEKPEDMSPHLFDRVVADLDAIGSVRAIVLGGIGEPTCAPLVGRAMEELGDYHLTLTTNGLDLGNALVEAMVAQLDRLVVSIDGTHETFRKVRGGSLDAVLGNIIKINQLKKDRCSNLPQMAIQFVISQDTVADVMAMVDLAASLQVHTLMLVNLIPQHGDNAHKILYTRYENLEMARLFGKLVSYSGRRGINVVLPSYELRTERRCVFVESDSTLIGATGDVVPCYRLAHTYREYVFGRGKTVLKHAFGNVGQESLETIWKSPAYASFRHAVRHQLYPSCPDCDLVDGCDLVRDTSADCYAGTPSCADCLWARRIAYCP